MRIHPTYASRLSSGCALLFVFLATGCGSSDGVPRGAVSGKVTLDGKPVPQGTISFVPVDASAGPSAGATIVDGAYAIDEQGGPVIGKNRVQITAPRKTGKKFPAVPPAPAGSMIEETEESVPAKYNTDSELERDIKAGENTLDFELTSK